MNAALATLRGVGPISFQMGCFTIHTKLPIGMGITLVAIPQSTPDTVTFSIPFDHLAVAALLDGVVGHGGCRRSAMPVFQPRRKPDHIAGPDFFDWAALTCP